jgi:hypothetical protein
MNYKDCPHHDELLLILSEGKDLEDISFEINEVENCNECSRLINGVCELWVTLGFVEQMKPKMNINDAKETIDTLGEQMGKVALKFLSNFKKNNGEMNS